MKIKFVILLLVIPFLGFCQKNNSVDIVVGLDYNYRTLHTSKEENQVDTRNDTEKAKQLWRLGFNYNIRVTNKLFFRTGLRVAEMGFESERALVAFSPIPTAPSPIDRYPTYPHESHSANSFFFLEFPIVLRYKLSKKKCSTFIEAGIGANYLLFSREIREISNERVVDLLEKSDEMNSYQISTIIAIGANCDLDKTLQLFAQPTFRYHLTPMWGNDDVQERLWSLGLELGLRKWFN